MCSKAFLCSQDGAYNFPLMPKLTTIGRENCDVNLMNSSIDSQHAVIAYDIESNSYSINDLNSNTGTYINGCRISNQAVHFNEQDTIKFGFNNPMTFQLFIQQQSEQQAQLIQQQAAATIPAVGLHRQSVTPNSITRDTVFNQPKSPMNRGSPGFWLSQDQIPQGSFVTVSPPGTTTISTVNKSMLSKNQSPMRQRPHSSQSSQNKITAQFCKSNFANTECCAHGRVNQETYRSGDKERSNELLEIERDQLKLRLQKAEMCIINKDVEIKDLQEIANEMKDLKEKLRELDAIKREKTAALGLVNTLQKDISLTEKQNSKLERDVELLKDELQSKNAQIEMLNKKVDANFINDQERLAKEKELYELRAKSKATEEKILELTGQVLVIKKELESSQSRTENFQIIEAQLKEDLMNSISRSQYEDMEQQTTEIRADLEAFKNAANEFRSKVNEAIHGSVSSESDLIDEDLITALKKLIEESNVKTVTINELSASLGASVQGHSDTLENLNNLSLRMSELKISLFEDGQSGVVRAMAELEALKAYEFNDSVLMVKETLINGLERALGLFKELEADKLALTVDLEEVKASKEAELSVLRGRIDELEKGIEAVVVKGTGVLADHEKELSAVREQYQGLIESLKSEHDSRLIELNNSTSELTLKLDSYSEEITQLKSELTVAKDQNQSEALSSQLTQIQQELINKEECFIQKTNHLETALRNAENTHHVELSIHKEQIKQHALTIVSFEKDIIRYKQQELELLEKIECLERDPPHPEPEELLTHERAQYAIDQMSHEIHKYKKRLGEQDELIKTLRRDLEGASAKLSDTHGEMTDKQKRELERNKALVIEQQKELSTTRAQLAKLSDIIEKQTEQLDAVNPELSKANELVDKYRRASEENGLLAVELKTKLEHVECDLKKFDSVKCEEGKITSELTATGAQCKGERHEQVITRQREALNELRQRVKSLEQNRPASSNQQQQMQQQLMLLKKQLAEVRASQALNEDIVKHVNLNRGQDESNFIIEEKTAHYETQSALEASEESYLTLLKTISCLIGINELDGVRSMVNLPCDERIRLNNERAKSIETIVNKIKCLVENLRSKEQLLKDYELDLAKLRQAEFLLDKKSEQLDDSHLHSRNKDDELACLKQSLHNVKAELQREILINKAFKEKKSINSIPLPINSARRGSTDTLHHHCKPDDTHHQNKIKKVMNEKIKRKDYELKTLKKEIKEKSEELSTISKQKQQPMFLDAR